MLDDHIRMVGRLLRLKLQHLLAYFAIAFRALENPRLDSSFKLSLEIPEGKRASNRNPEIYNLWSCLEVKPSLTFSKPVNVLVDLISVIEQRGDDHEGDRRPCQEHLVS